MPANSCSYCLLVTLNIFNWLSFCVLPAGPVPLIQRRAPIVNDAVTSNETLAASRNAFLIGHLFTDFDADEEKQQKNKNDEEDLLGGPPGSTSLESEDDGLLTGEEQGQGPSEGEISQMAPIKPAEQPTNVAPIVPTTAKATTTTTLTMATNNSEKAMAEKTEKLASPPQAEPIRPVNAPADERLADNENAGTHLDQGGSLSRQTAATDQADDGHHNQTFSSPGNSTQKPVADEEDATNPFIYPPTEPAETENQPLWTRLLFFTVISTGIGFFLLMLLVGLLARFEGSPEEEQPQSRRAARVVPAGGGGAVQQQEAAAIVVVRPSPN